MRITSYQKRYGENRSFTRWRFMKIQISQKLQLFSNFNFKLARGSSCKERDMQSIVRHLFVNVLWYCSEIMYLFVKVFWYCSKNNVFICKSILIMYCIKVMILPILTLIVTCRLTQLTLLRSGIEWKIKLGMEEKVICGGVACLQQRKHNFVICKIDNLHKSYRGGGGGWMLVGYWLWKPEKFNPWVCMLYYYNII